MIITDYSFATGESFSRRGAMVELVQEVRELMQHDWQPLGAPFFLERTHHGGVSLEVFCQVLVKTREGGE